MTILTFNVAISGVTTGFRPSLSVPEAFWDMRLRTALSGEAVEGVGVLLGNSTAASVTHLDEGPRAARPAGQTC